MTCKQFRRPRKHGKCSICNKNSIFCRDVTKFEFNFERWRISYNFTAFDIRRMWKLPSRRMRIHGLFTFRKCYHCNKEYVLPLVVTNVT